MAVSRACYRLYGRLYCADLWVSRSIENVRFNVKISNIKTIRFNIQQCPDRILQGSDGQCGHQCVAPAPAIAARHVYSRIPVDAAAGGLVPLSVLLAHLSVRQSDDPDSITGCAVCRTAFGQLFANTLGCKNFEYNYLHLFYKLGVNFFFSHLQSMGQNSWWGARLLISLVEFQTRNILRLASFSEIILMPVVIVFVFL